MTSQVDTLERLHEGLVSRLASSSAASPISDVRYDRKSRGYGIVHLGIGAFHRAHQAVYTDDILAKEGGDWKILAVSLRSAGVRDQLQSQDCLYTVVEMDKTETAYRIIGSVGDVLVAPESPQAVIDAMIDQNCRIISLTITEKGYCHDPATGRLNQQHPDIVHDLANPKQPKSAIGFIVEAIRCRREQGLPVATVMCCDNLPNNGATLKQIILDYASLIDEQLAQWIDQQVPFPNTMVDRIVPATQEEDIQQLQQTYGYNDLGMVKTERFTQWVIEDNFASGRPNWEAVGAMLVDDVEPFELAKLRLLNGTHSSLAYLGFLAGYEYVHQVVADKDFLKFLRQLMLEEIAPTLQAPAGMDLTAYADSLLERFANPGLNHKTYQIAMDGSQKLPQRLLGTLRDRLAAEQSIDYLSLAIAGWMRYVMAFDEKGDDIPVQDPMAEVLKTVEQDSYDTEEKLLDIHKLVDGYLSMSEIFGSDLLANTHFKERVSYWLGHILANGVAITLKIFLTR